MKQRIIFATGNKNKMREIHEILGDLGWKILSMKEAGIDLDIVEDGTTFEENALIKAKAVAAQCNDIVLGWMIPDWRLDYFEQRAGHLFRSLCRGRYFL